MTFSANSAPRPVGTVCQIVLQHFFCRKKHNSLALQVGGLTLHRTFSKSMLKSAVERTGNDPAKTGTEEMREASEAEPQHDIGEDLLEDGEATDDENVDSEDERDQEDVLIGRMKTILKLDTCSNQQA